MNNNLKNIIAKTIKPALISACLVAASAAHAGMTLVGEQSNLAFITSKNSAVTEVSSFKTLTGDISDKGVAKVVIDLASVDTAIPLRDERMQTFLFETSKFTEATFTANVSSVLKEVKDSGSATATITGELSMHGQTVSIAFDVLALESKGGIVVTTTKPALVKAADFNLVSGVEKLRELAGLNAINPNVPTSFVLTFK